MIEDHMEEIHKYAQQSPRNMINCALLALLSIRQHWDRIGTQMADVAEHGADSKYLFGFKRTGYKYLLKHAEALYTETMHMIRYGDSVLLLDLWATVPGLGLAKAGFVVQLVCGQVGCIDSHNARFYGVAPAQLRLDPNLTTATRARKLNEYVKLCGSLGGSVRLWHRWCIMMRARYPKKFVSIEAVSAAHLTYLRLGPEVN